MAVERGELMNVDLMLMLSRMDDDEFAEVLRGFILTDPISACDEAEGVWMRRVRRAYSKKTRGGAELLWRELIMDTIAEHASLKAQLTAEFCAAIASAYAIQGARIQAAYTWLSEKDRPKRSNNTSAPALIVVADGTPLTRIAPIAPDLRLPDNWFDLVRKLDIDEVLCAVEGVSEHNGGYTPCPMCRTTRRHAKDPRPPVTCGERVWTCWSCKARGDSIAFISAAMGHGMKPTGAAWREVGAWFVQRFSIDRCSIGNIRCGETRAA